MNNAVSLYLIEIAGREMCDWMELVSVWWQKNKIGTLHDT